MRDSREMRYYASIPKVLLLLVGSGVFVVLGYFIRGSGVHAVIAWLAIVFFGICALVALAVLIFAIVLRQPLLAIDSTGITTRQPLAPWKVSFVPWPEITSVSVYTTHRGRRSSSMLLVYARDRERYNPSPRGQRFVDTYAPAFQNVAISAQFTFLLAWASRKRCLAVLDQIQQTFAPEIIQYGVEVGEQGQSM